MWLATSLGFFSLVKKGTLGTWQIRGRERQDLLNALKALNLPADRLLVSRDTDYAYRIIVDATELTRFFTVLQETVNYPNFKSEVALHPDQASKVGPYHRIWGILADLQQPPTVGWDGPLPGKRSRRKVAT